MQLLHPYAAVHAPTRSTAPYVAVHPRVVNFKSLSSAIRWSRWFGQHKMILESESSPKSNHRLPGSCPTLTQFLNKNPFTIVLSWQKSTDPKSRASVASLRHNHAYSYVRGITSLIRSVQRWILHDCLKDKKDCSNENFDYYFLRTV